MGYLSLRPLAVIGLFVIAVGLVLAVGSWSTIEATRRAHAPGQCHPAGIRPSPATAAPGDTITITVTMDGTCDSNQIVLLSTSSTGSFAEFPSTATVAAGSDTATATARLSTDGPQGSIGLSASCNGVSAAAILSVVAN